MAVKEQSLRVLKYEDITYGSEIKSPERLCVQRWSVLGMVNYWTRNP